MKMKSFILTGCLAVCIVCPAAFAQDDYPYFEFFVGYSLMKTAEYDNIDVKRNEWREDLSRAVAGIGVNRQIVPSKSSILEKGFSTALTYNITPLVGMTASLRYNNGAILSASGKIRSEDAQREVNYDVWYKKTRVAFLVGPQLTFRNDSRITPFMYGLVGLSHDRLSRLDDYCVGNQCFSLPRDPDDYLYDEITIKKHNAFGVALGGGFDVSINDNWAIRAIQADYFIASHPRFISVADEIRNKRFDNLNLSFGVVYRFGE